VRPRPLLAGIRPRFLERMIPPAALRPTAAVELLHLDEEVRAAALLLGGLAGAVVAAMRCAHQAPWAASNSEAQRASLRRRPSVKLCTRAWRRAAWDEPCTPFLSLASCSARCELQSQTRRSNPKQMQNSCQTYNIHTTYKRLFQNPGFANLQFRVLSQENMYMFMYMLSTV
jgi:hypothetical protein